MFSLCRRTSWPKSALNSKAHSDARSQPPRCGGLSDLRPFLVSLSLSPLRPLFLSALSEAKARSSDALATQQQQTILPATRQLRKVLL